MHCKANFIFNLIGEENKEIENKLINIDTSKIRSKESLLLEIEDVILVEKLKEIKISVLIKEYGSSYKSLSDIQKLPDYFKLKMEFEYKSECYSYLYDNLFDTSFQTMDKLKSYVDYLEIEHLASILEFKLLNYHVIQI